MTPQRPLNIALIGLGMVAETHLQAIINARNHVTLRGVLARSRESAQTFVKRASSVGCHPNIYASIAELTADTELDFVIVATPPNARTAIFSALIDAGLPVLAEKPIERNSHSAAEIVKQFDAQSVMLGMVFQHRVRAASRQLASMLQSNAFGQLALVDVEAPLWRDQAYYDELERGTYARDGGGVLITQAIHTLDLMLSLTGPVTGVQAMCRTSRLHTMESEDFVSAGMTFANGAVGSLIASTALYPGKPECITLHFEHAVAELKRGVLNVHWRNGEQEQFGEPAQTGSGADPMAFTSNWHRDIIIDFANAVQQGGEPIASGSAGLAVQQLIDAIVLSSQRKAVVTLES